MYKSLVEMLIARSKDAHKGITFINGDNEHNYYSYKEMYTRATGALRFLRSKGIQSGDEVIFQIENNETFILAFWACILGGMIPVPVNVGNNDEHKHKLIKIWNVLHRPFLITDSKSLLKPDLTAHQTDFYRFASSIANRTIHTETLEYSGAEDVVLCSPESHDIAFIQFSSGTTGDPKGVTLTHDNLLTNLYDLKKSRNYSANDSFLSWMPLTHDMGMIVFHLLPLTCGGRQSLLPTWVFIRRPTLWIKKASDLKSTVIASPNFGMKYFLTFFYRSQCSYEWDLSNVRVLLDAAEPIDAKLCNEFLEVMDKFSLPRTSLLPGYGLAEATAAVTLYKPGHEFTSYNIVRSSINTGSRVQIVEENHKDKEYIVSLVDLGNPIENCFVRVCDEEDRVLDECVVGHVQIKGNNVTNGYYNNEEATRKVFTKDGWLRTGDLGFMKDGSLIVTGREKDIIFINGQNFYPQDIERVAEEFTGTRIGVTAACGVYNEQLATEEVILFVNYKDKPETFVPLAIELRKQLNLKVGIHVRHIIPVKKILKTTSGKVQRYKMKSLFLEGQFTGLLAEMEKVTNTITSRIDADQPKDTVEATLLSIWANVLGNDRLGVKDNFFEIGGTSTLLAQMFEQVDREYPGKITLTDLFGYPSISKLAGLILQDGSDINASVHIRALELPEEFFKNGSHAEEEDGLSRTLSFSVDHEFTSQLKHIAAAEHLKHESILLSMFVYLLYELSPSARIEVQTMMDGSGWVVPFTADFAQIDRLEDLFTLANETVKPGTREIYHIQDVSRFFIHKKNSVVPFICKEHLNLSAGNLLDVYDLVLKFNEDHNGIHFVCEFNSNEVRSEPMLNFIQRYAQALYGVVNRFAKDHKPLGVM
ncbi:non-ribosomal peptide synthetase [Paenibacillus graminis]|uniref:Carrier domain-containing protein n=1 Tax=Paenibacillus graminis TaxID=189425 RepID=A0A089MAV2_9BACL|nr:non-ribosomal peptide synthetase [Paenibacillus graminis]AIQ70931.1 hypothetical protein PGRAT_27435 [Paenibacillus graminis]